MENNSVNVGHLETKISRLSYKDMKKQDSLRYQMFSGFLAMVEMLQALRSLWEAIFPFALLWWNVMLCATCAKYYSWNRSRFRLQMARGYFYDEMVRASDAEEIEEMSALSFHHTEEVLHMDMKVITSYQSGSCTQASCGQKVDMGSCILQQSRLSSQDCTRDMFLHDPHVDNIEMCTEDDNDYEIEELQASVISKAYVSKSLDSTLPSCTSKLFSLHFCDERGTQWSHLVKAEYWATCSLLLPHQVAPLALYDAFSGPQELFEYLWMQSTLRLNRNLVSVKAPMQVLFNAYFSTLKEHSQISGASLAAWISLMIHSKEHAHLAKQFVKFMTSRGRRRVDDRIMRLVSSPFDDQNLTKNIVSSEALEGTMDNMNADIEKHPFSSHLSGLEMKSGIGHSHGNDDGDVDEDTGSDYGTYDRLLDVHYVNLLSGSQSSIDFNDEFEDGDAVQSRQIDVDDVYTSHFKCADHKDSVVGSGKEMGFSIKSSIHINDNYYDFYDRSDWDMRYDEPHSFPEVDSMFGGYYNAPDGVCSDSMHFTDSFGADDPVHGDTNIDDDAVHGNSLEVKRPHLSDTWWDEDAVLLDMQEREEDSREQAWQVV